MWGVFLATVRFDNFTDDTVIVSLNGRDYTLADEERVTVEGVEKGRNELRVHRARIPKESEDFHNTDNTDLYKKTEKADRSLHTQLDGIFVLDVNSSKAVITLKTKVRAEDRLGIDALFSGYDIEASGAKIENKKDVFAGKSVKKNFISHQIKEALLPVGFGGLILLFIGLVSLFANLSGKTVDIGGQQLTYPWTIGLLAVALGFVGYSVFVIIHSLNVAKRYK